MKKRLAAVRMTKTQMVNLQRCVYWASARYGHTLVVACATVLRYVGLDASLQ